MQKLTPLQKRIQERYVDDEPTKNKMLSQLFQAANVNPLAGCFPALIQIPIFISLYRALQNLIAENKLDEPFLWIPGMLAILITDCTEYMLIPVTLSLIAFLCCMYYYLNVLSLIKRINFSDQSRTAHITSSIVLPLSRPVKTMIIFHRNEVENNLFCSPPHYLNQILRVLYT